MFSGDRELKGEALDFVQSLIDSQAPIIRKIKRQRYYDIMMLRGKKELFKKKSAYLNKLIKYAWFLNWFLIYYLSLKEEGIHFENGYICFLELT